MITTLDGNFRDTARFLGGEDYFALEGFAEEFGNLVEAGFDLFANGRSDFELSSGVFHVHRFPP
jgi:hypothetical protein